MNSNSLLVPDKYLNFSKEHSRLQLEYNPSQKCKYYIDLFCCECRDKIYLIKNGWKVLSIDKENTNKIISSKLDNQ